MDERLAATCTSKSSPIANRACAGPSVVGSDQRIFAPDKFTVRPQRCRQPDTASAPRAAPKAFQRQPGSETRWTAALGVQISQTLLQDPAQQSKPATPLQERVRRLNACSIAFMPWPPHRIHNRRRRSTPAARADLGSNESVASINAQNWSFVARASSCDCKLFRPAEHQRAPTISVIAPQGTPPTIASIAGIPVAKTGCLIGTRALNGAVTRPLRRSSTWARIDATEAI